MFGKAMSNYHRKDLHDAAQGFLSLGVEIYQVP